MARPLSSTARHKLIDTAGKILFNNGVTSCTADEVASQSGVAKTTLFRHFGSMDALLFAAIEASVNRVDPPDTGTLKGELNEIIEMTLKALGSTSGAR